RPPRRSSGPSARGAPPPSTSSTVCWPASRRSSQGGWIPAGPTFCARRAFSILHLHFVEARESPFEVLHQRGVPPREAPGRCKPTKVCERLERGRVVPRELDDARTARAGYGARARGRRRLSRQQARAKRVPELPPTGLGVFRSIPRR